MTDPAALPPLLLKTPVRAVFGLGLPLAAATLFQAAFNLSEVWIFGQTGDGGASLAGAAVSDMLTAIFALLANGLGNAAVAQISRATGAGDHATAAAAARQALVIGGILSLASAVVGLLATPLGEAFMHPHAREQGTAFLRIMALGGFGTVFMVVNIGILRARGDALRPLILIACVSIATLFLEAAFVLGLFGLEKTGIEAAAWITVILRGLTAVWGVWMISRKLPLRPRPGERIIDPVLLRGQIRLGLVSAFQQSVRVLGMLTLVALATARLGAGPAAALFTALTLWSKVDIPMIMGAFAWGGGTAPVVGMALGAGRPAYARRAAWSGATLAACYALINTVLVVVAGHALITIFVPDDPKVIAEATNLLMHVAPCYALMAFGIATSFAFNGAGDMKRPLYWDLAILVGVQGGVAFFLGSSEVLGVEGFYIALTISGVLQGLVPGFMLARKKWV